MCFQLIEDTIVLYKDENKSSQHLYRTGQSVGTTVTFSTLATQVSKRQQNLLCTEKVCTYNLVMSNLADLAKNKRHSQKYNHVLSKLVTMTPQRVLDADLAIHS